MQNRVSYDLISKSLKTKICRTIIFPVVLYECATWSLILREENSLRVFEKRVLRKIFGSKWEEVWQETERGCIMRNIVVSTPYIISFG